MGQLQGGKWIFCHPVVAALLELSFGQGTHSPKSPHLSSSYGEVGWAWPALSQPHARGPQRPCLWGFLMTRRKIGVGVSDSVWA